MTGKLENGGGEGGFKARAGALTLLYLILPMKRQLLLAMLAEAATGAEIIDDADFPDPEELFTLELFADPYLVEPVDPNVDITAIDEDTLLRASPAGRDLMFVGFVLERWLRDRPAGPLELGPKATPALLALLNGWASTVIHALIVKPMTIAEITEHIGVLDCDSVCERVDEMLEVELVVLLDDGERLAATEWLRLGMAPLAAAARQELQHPVDDTAPIAALDVQAAFLLTLPLLKLPEEISGSCSLAVDLDDGVAGSPAGVTVRVEKGQLLSCQIRFDEDVDGWAAASARAWLDAVIELDMSNLRSGGDSRVAAALLKGLHERLFGIPVN